MRKKCAGDLCRSTGPTLSPSGVGDDARSGIELKHLVEPGKTKSSKNLLLNSGDAQGAAVLYNAGTEADQNAETRGRDTSGVREIELDVFRFGVDDALEFALEPGRIGMDRTLDGDIKSIIDCCDYCGRILKIHIDLSGLRGLRVYIALARRFKQLLPAGTGYFSHTMPLPVLHSKGFSLMELKATFDEMIATAERIGIAVRHVHLGGGGGGLVRVKSGRQLFIDQDAPAMDQLEQTARALAGLPELAEIYVRPDVREVLEDVARRN